jgi:hypothetical protein
MTPKGFKAQNILAVVSFDLSFQYVLAGWEGKVHDGRVLEDALGRGFEIPPTKYYLADAGYCNSPQFLTPYRGVQYHLKEWAKSKQQPQNAKELYNLRHSSLRNAVERTFEVLKKRFKVLTNPIEYNIDTQVRLVKALCCLHNFIKKEGRGDDQIKQEYNEEVQSCGPPGEAKDRPQRVNVQSVSRKDKQEAEKLREDIAESMWRDYEKKRAKEKFT